MIHPDKWLFVCCCECFCDSFSDEEGWYETWFTRSCKYINIGESNFGILQDFCDEIKYVICMESGSYFWYDAQCLYMLYLSMCMHRNELFIVEKSDWGVVARRFKSKKIHTGLIGLTSLICFIRLKRFFKKAHPSHKASEGILLFLENLFSLLY